MSERFLDKMQRRYPGHTTEADEFGRKEVTPRQVFDYLRHVETEADYPPDSIDKAIKEQGLKRGERSARKKA